MASTTAAHERLHLRLRELDCEYESLGAQLVDPEIVVDHRKVRSISIRRKAIEPLVLTHRRFENARRQVEELEQVLAAGDDAELVELARIELPELRSRMASDLSTMQRSLVTADDQAVGSVILEIRAGVGGDEAALWAGDLCEMYTRYAALCGWDMESLQSSPGDHGGVKQAVFSISGEGVWTHLGFEGGTHQVKRVPATEAQGRVHTSTATVAVLPEPEEVDVVIKPDEIKEIMTTAQGPGGQNVNKVATAVHLIHLPTGIEVRMQETKSQTQNRERAWKLLRARLYEKQKAQVDAERARQRNSMIGTADRAEKIRTYRWKENAVVDHRINESFNLAEIMAGRLQPLVEKLLEAETARRLAAL